MDRRSFLGTSAALLPSLLFAAENEKPSAVFHNGNILTVDPGFKRVEAFAVLRDRIVAVGTNAEMLALAGSQTQKIDLQGKMVMPGIIDSHTHPVGAAMYEFDHEIPTMETIADVLAYYRARAQIVPKGEWIGLRQVFITRLRDKRFPTRAELDAAAPEHPVFKATGPDAMFNSLGLAKLGITKDSGDSDHLHGGLVVRDPLTKEPTGMIRQSRSHGNILDSSRDVTPETRKARLKQLLTAYNSVGITTTVDRNASASDLALYAALKNDGNLTCRIYAFGAVSGAAPDEIEAKVKTIAATPLAKKDNLLWCGGVKMFLHGGMLTGSARMVKPWGQSSIYGITDPEYKGLLFLTKEQVVRFTSVSAMSGLQPALHCVGDGALEFLLDAFSEAAALCSNREVQTVRPGICHGNFMLPDKFDQMRSLGAVIDMQPAWLYQDGATLFEHFGEERMKWFQPYRALLDNKIPIGGGSDHMQKIEAHRSINLYCPFLGMWTTLTRAPRWTERILTPEQRITREEAIRFYTIDSAYTIRCEEDRGSLEVGKLADFIVLDRDILRCPVDDIRETKVLETWLGGKKVT